MDCVISNHNQLFSIIYYIFKQSYFNVYTDLNIKFKLGETNLESFFNSGTAFPTFACIVSGEFEIPKVSKHPITKSQKIKNVNISLQFLAENVDSLEDMPTKYVQNSEANIISYILNHHFYPMPESEIIQKSNLILKSTGKQVNERNDLLTIDYFISLINILADKDYKITDDQKPKDFVYNICRELKLPKFADGDYFGTTDQEEGQIIIFLIQEIFKKFSQKISKIASNKKDKNKNSNKCNTSNDNSDKISNDDDNDDDNSDSDNDDDIDSDNAADDKLIFDHDRLFDIINHFFKKKGSSIFKNIKYNPSKTMLENFFSDGISFPHYACLIADSTQIPKVNLHPILKSRKIKNVNISLQFLSDRVSELSGLYTAEYVPTSEPYIISYILSHYHYSMHDSEIIEKSNIILRSAGKRIRNKNDLLTIDYFISLINVLADKNYQIPNKDNLDEEYEKICNELNIPIFIESFEFGTKKHETALAIIYFIQEIFEIYSDKISTIINNSKNDKSINIVDEDDSDIFLKDTRENEKIDVTIEERENVVYLKLINHFASKMKLSFHDMLQSFEEGFIPKFIMNFLHIKSIDKVIISKDNTIDQHINNIEAVIEYLKQKNDVFKATLFDFKSPLMREFSCKLFYRSFFNSFFIKSSRDDMIDRYNILTDDNVSTEDSELLYHPFIFTNLLSFIIDGKVDKSLDVNETSSNEDFKYYFKKAHVPMILTIRALECALDYPDLQESFYFQLQLVFDEIDSGKKSRHVIESLKIAKSKIKRVEIPKFSTLKIAMKAKMLNNKRNQKKKDFKVDNNNQINSEIQKPTTFKDRTSSSNKKESSIKTLKSELNQSSKESLDYLNYQIHRKLYWSREHITLFINKHMIFLEEEYLNILKGLFENETYYLLFEQNIEVLEDQKIKDKEKIEQFFESYKKDIETKETPIKLDIKDTKNKGTSYIMKEMQKVTEIKVSVQIDQDLKSIIEQDF